jgi:hypothetical protein
LAGRHAGPQQSGLLGGGFIISAFGGALAYGMFDFIVWRFVGGWAWGWRARSPMASPGVAAAGVAVVINQLAIVIGLAAFRVRDVAHFVQGTGEWIFATMARKRCCWWACSSFPKAPLSPPAATRRCQEC